MNAVPLTAGQQSLLRAARSLQVAHVEARRDTARSGGVFPSELEQDCATLLLIAVTLLPEGLSLEGAIPAQPGAVGCPGGGGDRAAAVADLRLPAGHLASGRLVV